MPIAHEPHLHHGSCGQVYRYYVSAPLQAGNLRAVDDGAIRRVTADVIEALIARCVTVLAPQKPSPANLAMRVEIHPTTVQIVATCAAFFARPDDLVSQRETLISRLPAGHRLAIEASDPAVIRIVIPCRIQLRGGRPEITDAAGGVVNGQPRPDLIRIKALKNAHRLLAQAGGAAPAAPAQAMLHASPAVPYERSMLRLAFLAPDLQTQILEGRQPAGLTLQRFIASELPPTWDDQRRFLAAFWRWCQSNGNPSPVGRATTSRQPPS